MYSPVRKQSMQAPFLPWYRWYGEVPTTELWELFKGISDSATGTGADGQKEAISDENVPSPPEDASEDSDTEDNNDMQSEGLTNEEAGLE